MKRLVFLLLLLISFVITKADYNRMTFLQVIDNADLIAESEIIAVNDSMFWVKLKYIIKGSSDKKIIKVRKFIDWPCAHRPSPYKVGQKELLAVIWNTKLNYWQIIGLGNEGELFLKNGKITFRKLLYNNNYTIPQTYKRTDVYNGIRFYLKNYIKLGNELESGKILNRYPENKFSEVLIKTLIWKNFNKFSAHGANMRLLE